MVKKGWLIVALLLGLIALLGLPAGAAGPSPLATPVSAFPEWVNFYGLNSTLNGVPLPVGTEIVAYAGEKRCGSFVVHAAGQYGLLPCYRDQSGQPGALPGDTIRFTVAGFDAIPRGPDAPVWTNNGDRWNVELEASGSPGTTPTRTVLPSSTRTNTPILPATPTATPIAPTATSIVPPSVTWTPVPGVTPSATILFPPSVTPTPIIYTPLPASFCRELLQDGGFEGGIGWTVDAAARPATRTTAQAHNGFYSMRLGIDSESNVGGNSAVRQRIQIPGDAISAALTFWYYPVSEPNPGGDYWQVLLMEPGTSQGVANLGHWNAGNERGWFSMNLDLVYFRGRTLDVYFTMYNDGTGGRSSLYLDDVSLQMCTAGPPTFTPTPTSFVPSPTPYVPPSPWPTTAGACVEMLPNGDIEAGMAGWQLGKTEAVPLVVADPRHGGNRAMRLGLVDGGSSVATFSSIRQTIVIPADATSADLTFWVYLMSGETAGQDHQELVFLSPADNSTLDIPWRTWHENTRAWTQQRRDLLTYRGRSVILYFNVYNDGVVGNTAMVIDDISVRVCRAASPTAIPLSMPSATPGAPAQGAGAPTAEPTSVLALARPTPTPTPPAKGLGSPNPAVVAGVSVAVALAIALIVFLVIWGPRRGRGGGAAGAGAAGGTQPSAGSGGPVLASQIRTQPAFQPPAVPAGSTRPAVYPESATRRFAGGSSEQGDFSNLSQRPPHETV